MVRLGIGSYTYTWAVGVPGHPPERPLSAFDLLEKAAGLGVRLVQFADNLPLDQLPARELEELERRARELDVSIEVGTRGIAPDQLYTYLGLARRFNSSILRVVVDTPFHRPDPEEIVLTLKQVLPRFEQAGVRLALENHDRFKARTLAGIVERVGSEYLGICLDTANSLGALEDLERVVEVLGPMVINLHIKDLAIFRASHKLGFTVEGRPAGQGQLNIPWLLGALEALGRDPSAILELWTPPEAMLPDTIAKEEAWARASVDYLRSLIAH